MGSTESANAAGGTSGAPAAPGTASARLRLRPVARRRQGQERRRQHKEAALLADRHALEARGPLEDQVDVLLAPRSDPGVRRVRVWHAHYDTDWPEDKYLREKDDIGICLSGGGIRSFASSMGALRFLLDAGILQRARYLTAASGGAWAAATYTFAQPGAGSLSDDALLGDCWAPEDITVEKLTKMDPRSARAQGVSYWTRVMSALHASHQHSDLHPYAKAMNDVFLERLGVHYDALLTLNKTTKDEAITSNPTLQEKIWCLPHPARPFPIICATLLRSGADDHAWVGHDSASRRYVQHEATPLYAGAGPGAASGSAHESFRFVAPDSQICGQTELHGCDASLHLGNREQRIDDERQGFITVNSPAPGDHLSLGRILGQTSWGIGASLHQRAPESLAKKLNDSMTFPSRRSERPKDLRIEVTDGGNLDNLGIMPLLRRKVPRVILVLNTDMADSLEYEQRGASRVITRVSTDFAALFGEGILTRFQSAEAQKADFSEDFHRNHVFREEDFDPLVQRLADAQARGRGAVAKMSVRTIENTWFGVGGGDDVSLTVVYLARMEKWTDSIPEEVRQLLEHDTSLENFPFVVTNLPGGELVKVAAEGLLAGREGAELPHELKEIGVNLLATFTYTAMSWYQEDFQEDFQHLL